MSFLLNFNSSFSVVDNNSKYGIFCQLYNHTGTSRPLQVQTLNCNDYSATMDAKGNLHVIAMPTRYQILYFCYENGHYSKKTLVENTTETYAFSNPIIHSINNQLHAFYLSNRVGSNAYAIVHQTLNASSVETLLDTNYTLKSIKSFSYQNSIYIFYMIQNDDYLINCLKITGSQKEEMTLLTSKLPICDFSVCINETHIDLAYVAELHGKYQLVYYNCGTNLSTPLCHTLSPSNPAIFWYKDYLWINYLEDNKLYALLSIDSGNTFSSPVLTSIQNNTGRYGFITNKECSLRCTELYASVTNSVRINTLFTIDFDHIHLDSKVPLELELLVEGLTLSQNSYSQTAKLMEENVRLKEENRMLKIKYEQPPVSTPSLLTGDENVSSSVKSAASAFMEELTIWDAPPRL
ncbi:hypothetical protein [Cellulosilyticum sp. I15G10I2]|uniref:hypothetical protein n=1 Tax=Cellulosilyticum sp. I15G10I2 TaxID=1892843 RepID=UPI00085BC6B0|nr:hypothetical protein [Cellulosilyticum sp. I15G10I2]